MFGARLGAAVDKWKNIRTFIINGFCGVTELTFMRYRGPTWNGSQEHVGLDVPVDVVVAVRLQRWPGAADGLECGQAVGGPGFDAPILLDGDPLGRRTEDGDADLVNLQG